MMHHLLLRVIWLPHDLMISNVLGGYYNDCTKYVVLELILLFMNLNFRSYTEIWFKIKVGFMYGIFLRLNYYNPAWKKKMFY